MDLNMRPDDHEAAMARDQLEGWVQAKITKAADYVASVYHYMEYEMKFSEYGNKIENSDMYSESVKAEFRQKLVEAKQKLNKLKKAAQNMDESGLQLPYDPDGESAPPPKGKDGKYPVIVAGPNKGIRWGDINPKTGQKAMGPTNPALAKPVREAAKSKKGDGNLANNAKPYDKVTRGDVVAGRLGKDEKGGKAVKEESSELKKTGDSKKTRTGVLTKTATGVKHVNTSHSDEEHGEPTSKVKQKSAAEKKADKAREIKLPKHKGNTWGMKGGEKFGKKMENTMPDPQAARTARAGAANDLANQAQPTRPVKENKCNHTPKGKSCPVHGLKECGSMMEAGKSKNLKQQAAIAIAKKKAA